MHVWEAKGTAAFQRLLFGGFRWVKGKCDDKTGLAFRAAFQNNRSTMQLGNSPGNRKPKTDT